MRLCKWEDLPKNMQNEAVRPYYDLLRKKGFSLICKRWFDFIVSLILLILLSPVFLVLAIAIKIDSRGPVFFRQERVTRYGKRFLIHKFRTMVPDAEKKGSLVTVGADTRVTRMGGFLRRSRLDELAQLLDVISGNMTLVGVRPEVPKYVDKYTDEMLATLLLPAGVTNLASICYKDEAKLLNEGDDIERVYTEKILPEKMKYNLEGIKEFGFWRDIRLMFKTVGAVLK